MPPRIWPSSAWNEAICPPPPGPAHRLVVYQVDDSKHNSDKLKRAGDTLITIFSYNFGTEGTFNHRYFVRGIGKALQVL